jgi:hypothetical protein
MGLLDDFGIDLDTVEATEGGFVDPEEGHYAFTVSGLRIQRPSEGSTSTWEGIIIDYLLDTGENYSELFGLPADADNPTAKEKQALGRYKHRIMTFGFAEEDVNGVGQDDVLELTGEFDLVRSKPNKQHRTFLNVFNLVMDEDAEPEPEPAKPAKPAAKATTSTKRPSRSQHATFED